MSAEQFDGERVQAALRTPRLGRPLLWLPTVDSTQEELRRQLAQGAPAGTVVVADDQTAGRGRRGNVWYDRPGQDLLFSVALPADLPREGLVAVALGAYLAEALGHETRQDVRLRWPNDLVMGFAKVGGLLLEVAGEHFLAGVGINVAGQAAEIARQVGRPVTTLQAGTGRALSREELLAVCLNTLDRAAVQLAAGDRGLISRKIADLDALRDRTVTVTGPQGTVEGTAVGVALNGALLVRSGSIITEVTVADEVTVQAD
jgi:BirA family biotin operon repressor/biotin-[acetyl-CoA-carboxylase] ligase